LLWDVVTFGMDVPGVGYCAVVNQKMTIAK
jgi:hypothetical protein